MKTSLTFLAGIVMASPAFAATGPFVSLRNTNFIVLLAFLLFIAVLIYFKVPGLLMGMLDKRAEGIKSELDEARALREEAQTVLASYERKQREVQEQANRIVETAKHEAEQAADEEQITSAQAEAVRDVRDQAINIAVAAAREVLAKQMTAASANALINDSIKQVDAKLH